MKSIFRAFAIAAAILSLTACGLPGAVARTASNTVKSVGKVVSGGAQANL